MRCLMRTGGAFPDGAATYACEQSTGVAYALPPYEPVLEGAVFDGWWTDPAEGAPIKATMQVNETRDIRFYAHWEGAPAAMTVRFNANGGTVEPVEWTYYATLTYGELPVPTREHYRFTGWWTAASGGNKVVASSRVPAANQELFAHWTPEMYVIWFHANGGDGTMADQTFTYGSPVTLRGNTFLREGWEFAGWALAANGSVVYADKASFSEISAIQDGVIHLYAVWSDGGYAVRFDSNGGTGRMDNQTFRFGVSQTLSPNQFSRGRFRFLGWSLTSLDGVVYADGAVVRDLTATPGAAVVLYAVWELPAITEDSGVADVLVDSPDRRLKAKVTTADAYAGFREWALGVKGPDGRVASANAVLASEHAWASYVLGAEALFGNAPEIRIENLSLGSTETKDPENLAMLRLRVTVKDVENVASIDTDKVAPLFKATRQIGDWTEPLLLPLTVTAKGTDGDTLLFDAPPRWGIRVQCLPPPR